MSATFQRRPYHPSVGYAFIAAFLLAVLFAHFVQAPRLLVYLCVAVEVAGVVSFALSRKWLLLVSGLVLILASLQ